MTSPRQCLISVFLVFAALAQAVPSKAAEDLSGAVADGKPWEMFVVKRRASNIFVFRPDGVGTISDSLVSITTTWRATPGGICIKPDNQTSEKCLSLSRTREGIAASQDGKVIFILKR